MDIKRDNKTEKLWLDQTKYTMQVLARFNMTNAKPVSVLLASYFKLSNAQYSTVDKDK
jgi:hypothetical protein